MKITKDKKRISAKRRDKGVALFLAISFLALFSVLGASYMRFMSLELDETDMRIRDMRVRNYATAGINNAAGHIRSALLAGKLPRTSYTFTYSVYGESQEVTEQPLQLLPTYTAQAQVSVQELDKKDWDSRIANDNLPWPGPMRAFCITSNAELQQAIPGSIITLADHAQEAILVMEEKEYHFITWHAVAHSKIVSQEESTQ